MALNAIKFYFKNVLGRNLADVRTLCPREGRSLPVVLSEQEVRAIFNSVENLKHKVILMTIYSAGLRISEAVALKKSHIDRDRGIIRVVRGKGRKDRITPLSCTLVKQLDLYESRYHPVEYLFEGQSGGKYSTKNIQKISRRHEQRPPFKNRLLYTPFGITFATHLLENGTDIRYIQEILGHQSSKTTEIYTHVSTKNIANIRSPLDSLF